ncbi:MAG TPA: pyrroline-5-carboxylate reductase [Chlamydiales bacterium]|nr:pyrroline-5-carboxylate reductase [Chlamydiales bacterium]
MQINQYRLGFLGFGHMAKALCRAIDKSRLIPRSQILFCQRDLGRMKENQQTFGITATSLKNLVDTSDLLLLCVRPSELEVLLKDLKALSLSHQWVISIVAGVKIAHIQTFLGKIPVIRAMPNLPTEVGMGMTTLSFSPESPLEFQSLSRLLFKGMGEIAELPEIKMDIATAIAGSGPAYVFALIEAAARLGEKNGIPYAVARRMAAQTFLGAGKMILESPEAIQDLIQSIAVPNGITEAGFRAFREHKVESGFEETLLAAFRRACELA